MIVVSDISSNEANSIFDYDVRTGDLIWKYRDRKFFQEDKYWKAWNSRHAGRVAGSKHLESGGIAYVVVRYKGKLYRAHRVILAMFGYSLRGQKVDHIDGNGCNNRLCNLRVVDAVGNGRNQRIRSTNKSGVTGVTKIKATGKWMAYITDAGKNVALIDTFDFFEAVCRRRSAEIILEYHENHGRRTIETVRRLAYS